VGQKAGKCHMHACGHKEKKHGGGRGTVGRQAGGERMVSICCPSLTAAAEAGSGA